MKISGVVIAKNEEEMIVDCLDSLKFCDEVLVIDNGSTDKTADIAKKAGARVIIYTTDDFSKLRNKGLESSNYDWIVYIDTDERVTRELEKEIIEKIKNSGKYNAFRVRRKNFYFGKNEWPEIEKLERVFKKESLSGWKGKLHESPTVEGEIGDLNNFLIHYSHRDLTQMLNKTIEWSEIEAETRLRASHPKMSWWRFPRVMMSAFFDSYINKKGYKAGTAGIVESIYQAFSMFITYAKLWEKQIKQEK